MCACVRTPARVRCSPPEINPTLGWAPSLSPTPLTPSRGACRWKESSGCLAGLLLGGGFAPYPGWFWNCPRTTWKAPRLCPVFPAQIPTVLVQGRPGTWTANPFHRCFNVTGMLGFGYNSASRGGRISKQKKAPGSYPTSVSPPPTPASSCSQTGEPSPRQTCGLLVMVMR